MSDTSAALRSLPSVDRVLRDLGPTPLPRPMVVNIVRECLAEARAALSAGKSCGIDLLAVITERIRRVERTRLMPVINATGIVIHTNLGRSPLSTAATNAVAEAAAGYTNLEFDLDSGERGRRGNYVEHALALLSGAESATVVNNCAAALILVLRVLAGDPRRKHVVISRGELVQIGGGFRVPEILEASGAALREVGTTNKTTLADYHRAMGDDVAMILKVHRSNFYMDGFVESPSTAELSALAHEYGVPMVEDLGSGATFPTETIFANAEHEPTPEEVLAAGVDLVCYSGDKLLGGPQAGIIAGRADRVAEMKRHPFFRALRCDKLVFAALQATVDALLDGQADDLPIRRMIGQSTDVLRQRGERIITAAADSGLKLSLVPSTGQVGGGSLPKVELPSLAVVVACNRRSPLAIAQQFRHFSPPVIGFVSADRFMLDLRTVFPEQDADLINAIRRLGTRG